MTEVEVWANGHFVAVIDLPPFPAASMPEVVVWGTRTFVKVAGHGRPRYREAFACASLTPSPGRPFGDHGKTEVIT